MKKVKKCEVPTNLYFACLVENFIISVSVSVNNFILMIKLLVNALLLDI